MILSKLKILTTLLFFFFSTIALGAGDAEKPISKSWSFEGIFGTFDRASLQRGFQVYKEVCASCHSMKQLSYRNLAEKGGPEFTEEQVKVISSKFEVTDGPNDNGDMFKRPGKPSDKFVSPFLNEKAARAANGGAYPPDLSVIVKARADGADYVYSLLLGYEEKPPKGMKLEDGVYYNKYMPGNKIRMPKPFSKDGVKYADGTNATEEQISADVTTFLMWTAEPHLESRKRVGFKSIIYLLVLISLVYLVKKKIWSRIESKV
jgi:ubiquinol-cytochrome c reductase cytochrome c1 subunit